MVWLFTFLSFLKSYKHLMQKVAKNVPCLICSTAIKLKIWYLISAFYIFCRGARLAGKTFSLWQSTHRYYIFWLFSLNTDCKCFTAVITVVFTRNHCLLFFLFELISNTCVTVFIVFDLHQESDKLREGGKGGWVY